MPLVTYGTARYYEVISSLRVFSPSLWYVFRLFPDAQKPIVMTSFLRNDHVLVASGSFVGDDVCVRVYYDVAFFGRALSQPVSRHWTGEVKGNGAPGCGNSSFYKDSCIPFFLFLVSLVYNFFSSAQFVESFETNNYVFLELCSDWRVTLKIYAQFFFSPVSDFEYIGT